MNLLLPALMTTGLALVPLPTAADTDLRGSGVWPLAPVPEVVRRFDPPDSPFGTGHRGVDLAGAPGQVVVAALAGQVTFAGRLAGRGVVVVSHGSTRTTYEPVRTTARVGDLVGTGEPIGVLELALSHCPPSACLHWGWLRAEVHLDPLDLVGAGRVRLLPVSGLSPVTTLPLSAGNLPTRLVPRRVRLDGLGGGLSAGARISA
jgi:murein DD-endopeptidase MepM/ murein hydrolase activator NlpD